MSRADGKLETMPPGFPVGFLGVDSANKPVLTRAYETRNPNGFTFLGDSRMDYMFQDGSGALIKKTAFHWFNQANALRGQRLKIMGHFAVSGQRSDQYLAYLDQALATDAKHFVIWSVVNDAAYGAGDYFNNTIATDGTLSIKAACEKILAYGGTPWLFTDPGSYDLRGSSNALRCIQQYNQRIKEYAASRAGRVVVVDVAAQVVDPTQTFRFKSGYSADIAPAETHFNIKASQAMAVPFLAAVDAAAIPPIDLLPISVADSYANNGLQIFRNVLFNTATGGGAPGSGITGTFPQGMGGFCQTGVSASVAVSSGPFGNDVVFTCTATQAGAVIIDMQTEASSNAPGDKLRAVAQVDVVSGAVNLSSPNLRLKSTRGGVSQEATDFYSDTTTTGGPMFSTADQTFDLQTPEITVGSGADTECKVYLYIQFVGAGSATVKLRRAAVYKAAASAGVIN